MIMTTPSVLSMYGVVWLLAGVSFLPREAGADFFRYKDSSGTIVITNRLEDVPHRYRNRVKVVWDRDLEAKDPLARRRAEAERLREQRESLQEQRKTLERRPASDGKTLVITIDEETGQVIRKFE